MECVPICSISSCRRTASRCGRRRRAIAPGFWWCGNRPLPGPLSNCKTASCAICAALLRRGDAVVVNDTKVFLANLHGRRLGRGEHEPAIAATLISGSTARVSALWSSRQSGSPPAISSASAPKGRVCFLEQLDATVEHKGQGEEGGEVTLAFSFSGAALDQALAERGDVPLPPYISSRRDVDEQDRTDYQTMFAREEGSVAAPTAGLHFTEALTASLRDAGIDLFRVTLHVGPGTFCRSRPTTPPAIKCIRNGAAYPPRLPPR